MRILTIGLLSLAAIAAVPAIMAQAPTTSAPTTAAAAIEASAPEPVTAEKPKLITGGDLIPVLKAGGHIILMRHERTEVPAHIDDYSKPVTDCTAQRNLSVAGYAGAAETGKSFVALNIPIATVLASPMCRTMETGRVAFGRVSPSPQLMHHNPPGGRSIEVAADDLKTLVSAQRPTKVGNIMMISHIVNINAAYGAILSEGEMLVLKREPSGTIRIIGTAMGSDFGPDAREVLGSLK